MMSSIPVFVTCLLLTDFFIQTHRCVRVANDLDVLESGTINSLGQQFILVMDRIKQLANRFRCPKGWRRLGGSCYYHPPITSFVRDANRTCHRVYGDKAALVQVRNPVEFFYAAHLLARENLTTLMIEIDPTLVKGEKISETFLNDQARWERIRNYTRLFRLRYQKFKEKILDQVNASGFQIRRHTKKIKTIQPEVVDEDLLDYDDFMDKTSELHEQSQHMNTSSSILTPLADHDEYEYDNLDTIDPIDPFEQIDDMRNVCYQIAWNVLQNHSNVFVLSTYMVSDKTICSLSDINPNQRYHQICEYVLDFCFANILCGTHGRCVNTLTGFKCTCSFLFGGFFCEKISDQGGQILISVGLIAVSYLLAWKPIRKYLKRFFRWLYRKRRCCQPKVSPPDPDEGFPMTENPNHQPNQPTERHRTIIQKIVDYFIPREPTQLIIPVKRNLVRLAWVGGVTILILILLFVMTTVQYFSSFHYDLDSNASLDALINDTFQFINNCERISDYRMGNLLFFPMALSLTVIFSWFVKRQKTCLNFCDNRPGLIAPLEPFRTANRFSTATVFGILAFEVWKIFEEALFQLSEPKEHGVLVELLIRLGLVVMIGSRYYPILASLQLKHPIIRLFAFLYIIGDIIYTITREGACMGYIPLPGTYSAVEEAKIRMELGTWFIIYGLAKNIPHFFLLSYLGAELTVRFFYDSLYVPIKKETNLCSAPIVPADEKVFAYHYVKKLLQRRDSSSSSVADEVTTLDEERNATEPESIITWVQKRVTNYYRCEDDFRFSTMATCTYTVAFVFLYYLACTFVFLYISRTTGHLLSLKSFIEYIFNIEFEGPFSLHSEVLLSAAITGLLFIVQLLNGIRNYKKHKRDLYKGIYEEISSSEDFKRSEISNYSVHYSGFLIGYMAWGFVICFHLILIILVFFRLIFSQTTNVELFLAIIIPIVVIYLFKMLSIKHISSSFFNQGSNDSNKAADLLLEDRRVYAFFLFFSFLADCFIGIASCIIRLVKGLTLNLLFMARLDVSYLGRQMDKNDVGFKAYVSYLHIEATHTNPIMQAFCYLLYDKITENSGGRVYDDECCIGPTELDTNSDNNGPRDERRNRRTLNETVVTLDRDRPTTTSQLTTRNDNEIRVEQRSQDPSTLATRADEQQYVEKLRMANLQHISDRRNSNTARPVSTHQDDLAVTTSSIPPRIPRRQDLSSSEGPSDSSAQSVQRSNMAPSTERIRHIQTEQTSNTHKSQGIVDSDGQNHSRSHAPSSEAQNSAVLRQKKSSNEFKGDRRSNPIVLPDDRISNRNSPVQPNNTDIWIGVSNRSYESASSVRTANLPGEDTRRTAVSNDPMSDAHDAHHHGIEREPLISPATENVPQNKTQEMIDAEKKKRRLRFRWNLLYTLINNYRTLDLRKDIQKRLIQLHIQRSQLNYELANKVAVAAAETVTQEQGQLVAQMGTIAEESTVTPKSQAASLTVPVDIRLYPSSPAEHYLDSRSRMLYDPNFQPVSPIKITNSSPAPEAVHPSLAPMRSSNSLGFSPTAVADVPSVARSELSNPSGPPTTATAVSIALSSNASTTNHPVTPGSTIISQLSFNQQMQLWQTQQSEKAHKKHPHRYVYGNPKLSPMFDPILMMGFLTPQVSHTLPTTAQHSSASTTTTTSKRQPTQSPFTFNQRR